MKQSPVSPVKQKTYPVQGIDPSENIQNTAESGRGQRSRLTDITTSDSLVTWMSPRGPI
jgi:hypothetical protein